MHIENADNLSAFVVTGSICIPAGTSWPITAITASRWRPRPTSRTATNTFVASATTVSQIGLPLPAASATTSH